MSDDVSSGADALPQPATPTPRPQWFENQSDATLWSASGADTTAFAVIPRLAGKFRAEPSHPSSNGRVYVYYPGDDAGVQAGSAWVEAAILRPSDDVPTLGMLKRPPPGAAYVSPYPRPLPRGQGRLIRRVETSAPLVALTLDDSIDQAALTLLAEKQVKATLFLSGAWIQAHPETAIRALPDGHELGNHTWSHPHLSALGTAGIAAEIHAARATIAALSEAPAIPAFRPPWGEWSSAVSQVAAEQGYDVYLWDVESQGYLRGATGQWVAEAVLAKSRAGSIILMHPRAPADAEALGMVIDGLRARGLEPARLSDLVLSAQQ